MKGFCQIQLTCGSESEAQEIASALLEQRLVVCVKRFPVSSSFHWKGNIESYDETLLLMDTVIENFEKIEKEVKKHHSYETFVMQAFTIDVISKEAYKWLNKEVAN